ncbi:MAG: ATP-binding protein [Candidatus Promineifilaceae bacterium]
MSAVIAEEREARWLRSSPWSILAFGVSFALFIAIGAVMVILQPSLGEMATLVGTLAATSVLSLATGFFLYRKGWASSPSLSLTLLVTYAWAALLTLINVWILARLMFVSQHDLSLAGILLVFAAIIAMTFGVFVAAKVTGDLRQLSKVAHRLAEGDLSARAEVDGRDEVSQVATAFNEMANQLQIASEQRAEVENLRRDLIAWTSHDLRTPLTSIRVMIEALNDGLVEDEETKVRYYRTIRGEIVSLNNLIDDLFELAQLDAGGIELKLDLQSLSDLISDTLESFRPLAELRSIKLNGSVEGEVDPVMMNAPKISRVLYNLVDNAIQHSPDGGEIHLEVSRIDEGVQVEVKDSGPGFSQDELPRVFERFYRGETARSRAKGGAGLGLAIACGIVEAHGGRIWADNREEKGALVGFMLPDDSS